MAAGLFSHESFGHVLMLDSYMHACDRSMGAIELHDPTGCFMSVGKITLLHDGENVVRHAQNGSKRGQMALNR